jgi:hypothetical protein
MGEGINVLYASTLDDMGIPRSQLRPSTVPMHVGDGPNQQKYTSVLGARDT